MILGHLIRLAATKGKQVRSFGVIGLTELFIGAQVCLKILLVVKVVTIFIFAPAPLLNSEVPNLFWNLDTSRCEINDLGSNHESLFACEMILRREIITIFIKEQLHTTPLDGVLQLVDPISKQD